VVTITTKQLIIMTTQEKIKLIAQITPLVQRTHNEKDIADLQTFSVEELQEILIDLQDY